MNALDILQAASVRTPAPVFRYTDSNRNGTLSRFAERVGLVRGVQPQTFHAFGVSVRSFDMPILRTAGVARFVQGRRVVFLPDASRFVSRDGFLEILSHELAHATGESVGRPFDGNVFVEELVAETAAYLVLKNRITTSTSADFLAGFFQHWSGQPVDLEAVAIRAERSADHLNNIITIH